MSFNKLFSTALFLIGFIALFLHGCSEENNSLNTTAAGNLDSPQYAILDYEDALSSLGDATLESDMTFGNFPPGEGMGPVPGASNDRPPRNRGRHFFHIFKDLNLTSDQIESVKTLMEAHRECMHPAFEYLREVNGDLLEAANEERRLIHQQVADGLITREEAHELLRILNEETREAVRNNPASEEAHAEMCACKLTLLEAVAQILDDAQLIIWNEWVAQLEGPCFID